MHSAVYVVNAIILGLCGILLLRGYRRGRQRLLLWSGLCFSLLSLVSVLDLIDLVLTGPRIDLYPLRLSVGAVATSLLVFGLVWESDRFQ